MTTEDVCEFLDEHRDHNILRSGITLGNILDYMLKCMQESIDTKTENKQLTDERDTQTARADAAVKDLESLMKASDDWSACKICSKSRDGLPCNKACDPKWREKKEER